MAAFLKGWILSITAAAMLSSMILSIVPEGSARSIVKLACGAMAVIALIKPIMEFDYGAFALYVNQYREKASQTTQTAVTSRSDIEKIVIEEQLASYILDKGRDLGLDDLQVTVKTTWGGNCWYPVTASLATSHSGKSVDSMALYLESELGIKRDCQSWSTYDEQ